MELNFKDITNEYFDSMLLSFATDVAKKGVQAERYVMSIKAPSKIDYFYIVNLYAYKLKKIVFESEGGFCADPDKVKEFIDLEKRVAGEYNLPFVLISDSIL